MKVDVQQQQKCCLSMDGLFVFIDSDISEDELRELKKKIRKMHRKKTRKHDRGDSSSNASSRLSSKPSSPLSITCVENDDSVCSNSITHSTDSDVENTDACKSASAPRLQRKRKVCVSNVGVRSKKHRVNGENGIEGIHRNGFVDTSDGFKARQLEVPCCYDGQQTQASAAECGSNSDAEIRPHTISSAVSSVAENGDFKRKVTACEKKVVNGHGQRNTRNTGNHSGKAYSCVNGSSVSSETFAHVTSSATTRHVSWPHVSSCLTRCKSCASYRFMTMSQADQAEAANYVALDCEFVGVGPKKSSALGRCSIVDYSGAILFDRFVKPAEPVTDYRTPWSGLRQRDLLGGVPFIVAQEQIAAVIKDKVVIGHAVHNDFRVMGLRHPPHMIRDTAACKLLREMADLGRRTALKSMTLALLGRKIQTGEHCSVTDARAALDLFRLVRSSWEQVLQAKFNRRQARLSIDTGQSSDDPALTSFLEDHYWPADLFAV